MRGVLFCAEKARVGRAMRKDERAWLARSKRAGGAAGRGAASNGSGAPGGGGVVCQLVPGAHALGEGGPGAMDGRPGPKFSGRTAGAAFCPGLARDVAITPPANAVGLVVDARDHARPVLGHGRMPPACPHGEEPSAQRAEKRRLRGRSFAGVPPGTLAPTRRERCGPHPARGGLPGLWRLGVGMKKGGPARGRLGMRCMGAAPA